MIRMFNRRFKPRKTNCDWPSRDEEEVRKYLNDCLCGFPLTAQAWFDFFHGKRRLGGWAQPHSLPVASVLSAGSRVKLPRALRPGVTWDLQSRPSLPKVAIDVGFQSERTSFIRISAKASAAVAE
jgi:alpha-beta hydrolase superfamily lysophospholipase